MRPHATDCPGETDVRQPSAPPWEVADIFRLYGETYCRAHPVPPAHQRVMRDLAACRTAQLGGHAEQCLTCGFERYAYNSCRNRHCPKCQTFTKVQWVEERKAESLNLSQFVEGRRWWPWAREDLAEVRVFAGDGLCNGEKMVSFSASVYALQSVIN
jgi:predicted Zn-ribbon and HTH transcriptional regulator